MHTQDEEKNPEIHLKESTPCKPVSSGTGQRQILVNDKGWSKVREETHPGTVTGLEKSLPLKEGTHLQKGWLEPEAELWLTSQFS